MRQKSSSHLDTSHHLQKAITMTPTDHDTLVTSLTDRIKTLEAACLVSKDLVDENKQLKDRLEGAEASKEALMRLVW